MYNVDVYKGNMNINSAKLKQLSIKREWMSAATYHCYPLTFANTLGYGVFFEEDISFIWNGDASSPAKAINGSSNIWSGRPEGTVSFETNLVFKTEPNVSILTLPVLNQPIQGADVISSIVSSSFFTGSFPIVWKLSIPNKEYLIPAGQPIACILPISISQFQDSNINVYEKEYPGYRLHNDSEYIKAIHDYVDEKGTQPKLYKKGLNHHGEKIGSHEIENLIMKVSYK